MALSLLSNIRIELANNKQTEPMRNKFKTLSVLASALIGCGLLVQQANAIPISGSIGFTGTYSPVGETTVGDLSTATSMSVTASAIAPFSETGDFVGATLNSFVSSVGVNGNPPSIGQLFKITVGLVAYTFTVTSETQTFTSANQINLAGAGTFSDGTLADNASGTFQLGFGNTGGSFTFQSTAGTGVPDGGTTAMLLGAAISGLALIRRKLA